MENPYAAPVPAAASSAVDEPADATVVEFEDTKISKRRWRFAYAAEELVVTDVAAGTRVSLPKQVTLDLIRLHVPDVVVFKSAKQLEKRLLRMSSTDFDQLLRWIGWREVRERVLRDLSGGALWFGMSMLIGVGIRLSDGLSTISALDIVFWVASGVALGCWVGARMRQGQPGLLLTAIGSLVLGVGFAAWAVAQHWYWILVLVLFNLMAAGMAKRAYRYFARWESEEPLKGE
jgi:hypothetical protein